MIYKEITRKKGGKLGKYIILETRVGKFLNFFLGRINTPA